jgi:hypothetical protein
MVRAMAKRRAQGNKPGAPATEPPRAPSSGNEALDEARAALARGDARRVRELSRSVLAGTPPAPIREEAERLLDVTAPDKAALLTAALVFATIAIAAWVALLHRH